MIRQLFNKQKGAIRIAYFFTIAGFILSAFAGSAQVKTTKTTFQDFRITMKGVNFNVDPRIELFHTIEVLSGMPLVNFAELEYKQKILLEFAPYQTHPLFGYLKQNAIYGKLFNSIDAPISTMLNMTNDFEWRKDIPVPEAKDPGLDSLRILMKDFVRKSNYTRFFNSNGEFYRISLATLTYNLPAFNEKERLLNYCGVSRNSNYQFNVILNFLGWGNFGPRIFKANGAELYAVITPEKTAIRVPTFDVSALYRLLWHEFAHSFANPAIEKNESQYDQFAWMWEPVKEPMKAQAYHSWQSVFKEHLTEAIACRMAALKFGETAADLNYVRRQYGMHWIYLHPLLKALKHYENNRNKYPTLESFMPEVVKRFQQIKQNDIDQWIAITDEIKKPVLKTIPAIGDIYDQQNILFILSSNEADKDADRKLKEFIARFKNQVPVLKDAKIVADTTALKMDLSSFNLSVWGTPGGNKFLEKYFKQIPILIEDKRVIAENIYEGTGYGVLIGWVNPMNDQKVMAIYTGQSPVDPIDFNQVPNGSGNYHILNNKITIKQSNFSRLNDIWFAK